MQEYSLLHILGKLSMKICKRQIEWVSESSGFISFIVQLDHLTGERDVVPYNSLLAHLRPLDADDNLWMALLAKSKRGGALCTQSCWLRALNNIVR